MDWTDREAREAEARRLEQDERCSQCGRTDCTCEEDDDE